jgi:predicted amino acid racemase
MEFKKRRNDLINWVIWPEESVYKATGGFTLDKTNLKDGADFLEKGALMAVNFTTRLAKLVKTAILYSPASSDAVVYKIGKNNHFKVGDNVAFEVGGEGLRHNRD